MAKLTVCVFALLLLIALSETSFQGPCCTKNFNNPIRLQNLKAYWMQFDTGNCNINSTIFLTVKNKLVCANPDMPWVRRAIEYLK
ncbi:PREDICTED: C-C motif chemokine 5-like [Cyprinodon variegatus]|uniref:C-C motif chemokine 5-like n=1 Tax=Cyprinodon variegatus TaxID=28743 RepID=UPI000742B50F|nr:PREDICTED: C-C motif chemokine 5-like [Cyprinodon variegatus]